MNIRAADKKTLLLALEPRRSGMRFEESPPVGVPEHRSDARKHNRFEVITLRTADDLALLFPARCHLPRIGRGAIPPVQLQ